MTEYQLIDTSAWIEYFRKDGDPAVRSAVTRAIREKTVAWCELIQLELMRANENQRTQADLIFKAFPCLSIDRGCWEIACSLAIKATRKGRPVPNTDILIQACANHYGAKLLYRDRHFAFLGQL